MDLKQTFEAINQKVEEAGKQQADISQKLEANKNEKAKAEAAKAAALEAKDEQAYKAACRAIADADGCGCLRRFHRRWLQMRPGASAFQESASQYPPGSESPDGSGCPQQRPGG